MADTLKVYSYRRCPFAMRVRMTLHEKELPFETIEEDLKNFSEELRRLHPEAKVPVLMHGKRALYESAVITEYIEDAFPDKVSLMPKDPGLRAEVRLWTYWCNHIFKPDVDRYKYGTHRFPEEECVGAEERVTKHSEKLDTHLQKNKWIVGGEISLADIHLFPFCRQLARINPEPPFLPKYKNLEEWRTRISERPSFLKTMKK